jgi:UDP-N-acetylmuramate dehydrogenase
MLSEQVKSALANLISGSILFDEPMRNHTSFGIGGPADALITPNTENDIKHVLKISSQNNIPITVIGNGSNLLISDNGIEGIVIKIAGCFDDVALSGREVTAGAGCPLSKLSELVSNRGLSGLEFAVGIPGTVGGAVVTNAGAHEAAIGNVILKVKVLDLNCKLFELDKSDLKFSYRNSGLQNRTVIILNVEMELEKGDVNGIKKKMLKYLQQRKRKQPLGLCSAGSIFKNPENDYAGRLIEACGCRGMSIWDAQVSELHADFIVNTGNATAQDVIQLMNKVQKRVLAKYSIKLEPEINIMGKEMEVIK